MEGRGGALGLARTSPEGWGRGGGRQQSPFRHGLSSAAARQELEERQEAQCSRVEHAGEDPHSHYFPGQFAFFKALPPS